MSQSKFSISVNMMIMILVVVTQQNIILLQNVITSSEKCYNYYILFTNWPCEKCNKVAARITTLIMVEPVLENG